MDSQGHKEAVRKFLEEGFGERNLAVVDEVFASDHTLRSPALGTGEVEGTAFIKGAIEDIWSEGGEVNCTVGYQAAEGELVATSYTLNESHSDHSGIVFSRFDGGKVQESLVVARESSEPVEDASTRRKVFN